MKAERPMKAPTKAPAKARTRPKKPATPEPPKPGEPGSDLTFDGNPRCTATSKQTGNRCGRAQTPGTTVCKNHGSATPAVRRKAQLRLLELVDPAMGRLARILVNGSDTNALKAIEIILNRTGFPARMELDIDTSRELLIERLMALQAEQAQLDRSIDDAIDAEVIEDDTP